MSNEMQASAFTSVEDIEWDILVEQYKNLTKYCVGEETKAEIHASIFGYKFGCKRVEIPRRYSEKENAIYRATDKFERKFERKLKSKTKKTKKQEPEKNSHKPRFGETKRGGRVTKPKREYESQKGHSTHGVEREHMTFLSQQELREESNMIRCQKEMEDYHKRSEAEAEAYKWSSCDYVDVPEQLPRLTSRDRDVYYEEETYSTWDATESDTFWQYGIV